MKKVDIFIIVGVILNAIIQFIFLCFEPVEIGRNGSGSYFQEYIITITCVNLFLFIIFKISNKFSKEIISMGRDYNKYPEDMVELVVAEEFGDGTKAIQTFCNMQDLEAYFRYCHTSHESRQAYKDGNIFSMHEDLRITWIKEEKNLGYAVGRRDNTIKFYKIGKEEDWETLGKAMAAVNAHDNS